MDEDQLPFSKVVNVRTLPRKGLHVPYQADEEECRGIAARYDLFSVERFSAHSTVAPWKKNGVKVTGHVQADITQPCAVSGEPLKAKIEEELESLFLPEGARLPKPQVSDDGELVLDHDGGEVPDLFTGDSIDLAAVWLEFFALGIDPFAKIDGAVLSTDAQDDVNDADEKPPSPFAALAALKQQNSDEQ